jgi:hypothetical protein
VPSKCATAGSGFAVLMEKLQFKGCRLARKQNISVSKFKVIYGRARCFMARYNLTIKHQMMVAQGLSEAYEEKLVTFLKYVLKIRKQHEYLLGQTEC